MSIAIMCPGQGSQAVGMGQALADAYPAAASVFAEVDEALEQSLCEIMRDGPAETLTLTENAQPALMAVSIAALRALEAEGCDVVGQAAFAAGHSLGEYSALCAVGALTVGDTARLLKTRGQAMQAAVPVGEGAMAALLGVDRSQAEALAAAASDGEVCSVANDNAPGQVVISGQASAIARAVAMAKDYGAKRAIPLNVSAPFHCALMQPAADVMADALANVKIKAPRVPVVVNTRAEPISDPDEIRRQLIAQVTGEVRWADCVRRMLADGVTTFIEVGSGKVLSGLVRQIERSAASHTTGSPEEIAATVAALNG